MHVPVIKQANGSPTPNDVYETLVHGRGGIAMPDANGYDFTVDVELRGTTQRGGGGIPVVTKG